MSAEILAATVPTTQPPRLFRITTLNQWGRNPIVSVYCETHGAHVAALFGASPHEESHRRQIVREVWTGSFRVRVVARPVTDGERVPCEHCQEEDPQS